MRTQKIVQNAGLCALLLGISMSAMPQTAHAQSFTWEKADGTVNTYDSTVLTSPEKNFSNGDILTIYASEVTANAQFNANGVGDGGTLTIQSGTPGTQVTISTEGNYRFCDYAHGTYILKDLRFTNCGASNVEGSVFYRNDKTPSIFRLENVTVEGNAGKTVPGFRAATGMTVSGTAVFRNNTVTDANGTVLQVASGSMTLEGDDTVLTFTGSKNSSSGAVAYDLRASAGITFNDAGTYSLDGGMMAQTLVVNGANVTLGSGSKSNFTQTATVKAGKLTLNSANFNATSLTVDAGAVLDLKAAVTLPLVVNGTMNVGIADLTLTDLSNSSTDGVNAVIQPAAGITGAALALNNTKDTAFYGTVTGFDTVTKTGASTMKFTKPVLADKFIINAGTLSFDASKNEIPTIDADVYLDHGAKLYFYGNASAGISVLGDGVLYVGAEGGTLQLATGRGYLSVHSEDGVQSGNLILNGSRGFIVGESTFNGYYEITGGTTHFSNESLAKSKGIILNGGTLQYAGEIAANRALTASIFLKNASALQCGWSGTFSLSGAISDFEGADLTGKYLTVNGDSGYVDLNGSVNTKAIFRLNDNARTNGTNDVTFGGLQNGSGKTFTTTASSDTGKKLILNVAPSTSPVYSGTLSGNLNLVKEGDGTQTFQTVGVGTESAPLASVTVNDGTLKMSGVPLYAKNLTVGEGGTLAFAAGSHLLDADSINIQGGIDVILDANGNTTKLNVPTDAANFTADLENGIFNLVPAENYEFEQFVTYQIAEVFPDFGAEYDYDALLSMNFRNAWELSYVNGGLFLSMDNNVVPEPGTWTLLVLGILGGGLMRRRKMETV